MMRINSAKQIANRTRSGVKITIRSGQFGILLRRASVGDPQNANRSDPRRILRNAIKVASAAWRTLMRGLKE